MSQSVLVCDAGGTSVRFGLARLDDGRIALSHEVKYSEQTDENGRTTAPRFAEFSDALATWLTQTGIAAQGMTCLFALAGAVDANGAIEMTNRENWSIIRPQDLQAQFGLGAVTLVNDFAAMARAIPEMKPDDFEQILPGTPRADAPVIVTGPGTGFGIATLLKGRTGEWLTLTGQGGHAAYSPRTKREAEMAQRMAVAHGGYVSTEMVVSGLWLQPVFDVISDMHGIQREDFEPAEILAQAEAGEAVAVETCLMRARGIMGAAGDLVLVNGGQGGVVLTGGVAERMTGWLKHRDAVAAFRQRGIETGYVADVPVRVLMNPQAALIGAAALGFARL